MNGAASHLVQKKLLLFLFLCFISSVLSRARACKRGGVKSEKKKKIGSAPPPEGAPAQKQGNLEKAAGKAPKLEAWNGEATRKSRWMGGWEGRGSKWGSCLPRPNAVYYPTPTAAQWPCDTVNPAGSGRRQGAGQLLSSTGKTLR